MYCVSQRLTAPMVSCHPSQRHHPPAQHRFASPVPSMRHPKAGRIAARRSRVIIYTTSWTTPPLHFVLREAAKPRQREALVRRGFVSSCLLLAVSRCLFLYHLERCGLSYSHRLPLSWPLFCLTYDVGSVVGFRVIGEGMDGWMESAGRVGVHPRY